MGTQNIINANSSTPLSVSNGGTGANTLTDHGILLGSGTGAVTPTAAPTDGQLLIGSTGADPVLATLTAGTNITITNGAGSITIDATGGGGSAVGFVAYNSSNQNNVTGSGTTYDIAFATTTFNSGAYNTGTSVFTAPSTGVYCVSVMLYLVGITASHNIAYLILNIGTGSYFVHLYTVNPSNTAGAGSDLTLGGTAYIYLNNGDPVKATINVGGAGTDTVDIPAVTGTQKYTYWSAFKVG